MKIRLGFVSNSSSTSFTCDFCGRQDGGMEAGLEDCEMFECQAGHTICDGDRLLVEPAQLLEDMLKEAKEDSYVHQDKADIEACAESDDLQGMLDAAYSSDARYFTPTSMCPVCALHKVTQGDAYSYLLALTRRTREDVEEEIKEKFNLLSEVHAFIKEKTG